MSMSAVSMSAVRMSAASWCTCTCTCVCMQMCTAGPLCTHLVEHELAQLRREEGVEVEHHRHQGVPQPEGAVGIRADLAVEGVEPRALVQRAVPLAVRELDLAPPGAAEVRAQYLRREDSLRMNSSCPMGTCPSR